MVLKPLSQDLVVPKMFNVSPESENTPEAELWNSTMAGVGALPGIGTIRTCGKKEILWILATSGHEREKMLYSSNTAGWMDVLSAVPFSALENTSTTKQSKHRNVRKASWRGISCGARGQQWDTKPQPCFECAPAAWGALPLDSNTCEMNPRHGDPCQSAQEKKGKDRKPRKPLISRPQSGVVSGTGWENADH